MCFFLRISPVLAALRAPAVARTVPVGDRGRPAATRARSSAAARARAREGQLPASSDPKSKIARARSPRERIPSNVAHPRAQRARTRAPHPRRARAHRSIRSSPLSPLRLPPRLPAVWCTGAVAQQPIKSPEYWRTHAESKNIVTHISPGVATPASTSPIRSPDSNAHACHRRKSHAAAATFATVRPVPRTRRRRNLCPRKACRAACPMQLVVVGTGHAK